MKYILVYKPSLLFLDLLRETRLDFYQGPSRSSTSGLVHEHVFLPHKVSTICHLSQIGFLYAAGESITAFGGFHVLFLLLIISLL